MILTVGQWATLKGNITQLEAFGAMPPRRVEENLGYHLGRLARGYWICLLVEPLVAGDFELEGNTLRSGGKVGAPGQTQREDKGRTRVHEQILEEYGAAGYAQLQNAGLAGVGLPHNEGNPTGIARLEQRSYLCGLVAYLA